MSWPVSAERIAQLEQECGIGIENATLVVIPDANDHYLEEPARVRACCGVKHRTRDDARAALFRRLDDGVRSPVALWPCSGHWHLDEL